MNIKLFNFFKTVNPSVLNLGNNNPVATSHITGKNHRRYDYILNSKNWKVINLVYPYEESRKASSDHSIVIGDFENNNHE